MAVTSSIGSGARDYSTLQAWEDAIPGTITQDYNGEAYNDSEFTSSVTILALSGHTGSFWIRLRCASGQSYLDHASVRTNAKKYNVSNGVGLKTTTDYFDFFVCTQDRLEISGLQFRSTASHCNAYYISNFGGSVGTLSKNLIVDTASVSGSNGGVYMYGPNSKAVNVTVYKAATGGHGMTIGDTSHAIACDVIRDPNVTESGNGFTSLYSGNTIVSCNAFGFSNAVSGTWDTGNCYNNATNKSSGLPGTNNKHSVTYNSTTPFTNSASASLNLIPISGTDLIDNGFQDTTDAPYDWTGTVRDSTPTIGSWEVVAASGAIIGTSAGSATCSGTLTGSGALAGASAGVGSQTGALTGAGALAGTSPGSATVAGTLSGAGALTGTSPGTGSGSGTLLGSGSLSGTSPGSGVGSGTLLGAGVLTGSSDGVATVLATLLGAGALNGTSAGVGSASLETPGLTQMVGTAAGIASVAGTLLGSGALAGSSPGTATVLGVLLGSGSLSGASSGVGSASGTGNAFGALVGSSSGLATVVGILLGAGALSGTSAGGSSASLFNPPEGNFVAKVIIVAKLLHKFQTYPVQHTRIR